MAKVEFDLPPEVAEVLLDEGCRKAAETALTILVRGRMPDHLPRTDIEPAEVAWRRIARRKLKERGFGGDIDAELDRLLRTGIPGFRWPEDLIKEEPPNLKV